ncbi:MAG: hypothetical protein KF688_17390 [Pirellulales bacterium]|nr:hypothetical protein [Pirellulales bacterium]
MWTSIVAAIALLQAAATAAESPGDTATVAKAPEHQVIAVYFHRTQRCPTCKRIGALAEEAVLKGFPKEVKSRVVVFQFVDFQDKKNAALVKSYKVDGPVLVTANVFDGKVVRWEPLPKVWQLVGKPEELAAHVRGSVAAYLKQTKEEAESKE